MADLNSTLQQVKSNESFLERIKRWIPGYDGYVNRDNSRELDTLLRNQLATELDSNHMKLKNTILNLSHNGKLFETDGIDKLDKRLQAAVNKFRSAARGYSGAFDVVKVKDDKLNMIYQFDANMLDEVQTISNSCSEMENSSKAGTDIKPVVDNINAMLDSLIKQFGERENILNTV
jgi:hypothetical protein